MVPANTVLASGKKVVSTATTASISARRGDPITR